MNNKLIEALLAYAAKELSPEQASAIQRLIENNSDSRATSARDSNQPFDPRNVDKAARLLAAHGVDESLINEMRKVCGVSTDPVRRAMDAAICETDRLSRARVSYVRRFPNAGRIANA